MDNPYSLALQKQIAELTNKSTILADQSSQQIAEQEKSSNEKAYATLAEISPLVANLGEELKSKVHWAALAGDLKALAWIAANLSNIDKIDKAIPSNVANKVKWDQLLSDEASFNSIRKIFNVVLENKQKQAQQQTNQEQTQQ